MHCEGSSQLHKLLNTERKATDDFAVKTRNPQKIQDLESLVLRPFPALDETPSEKISQEAAALDMAMQTHEDIINDLHVVEEFQVLEGPSDTERGYSLGCDSYDIFSLE